MADLNRFPFQSFYYNSKGAFIRSRFHSRGTKIVYVPLTDLNATAKGIIFGNFNFRLLEPAEPPSNLILSWDDDYYPSSPFRKIKFEWQLNGGDEDYLYAQIRRPPNPFGEMGGGWPSAGSTYFWSTAGYDSTFTHIGRIRTMKTVEGKLLFSAWSNEAYLYPY